jgi:glycosyltransferase involved in cell wall biosynthesis
VSPRRGEILRRQTTPPIRVLFVAESTSASGGGENSLLDLCKGMLDIPAEIEPLVAGPKGEMAAAAEARGIRWYGVGKERWTLQPVSFKGMARLVRVVSGLLRAGSCLRPALIHANSLEAAALVWPSTVLLRIPLVIHWRGAGGMRRGGRLLLRAIARNAACVMAPTCAVRDYLVAVGLRADRMVIVPNPVAAVRTRGHEDGEGCERRSGVREATVPEGSAVIVAIGRAVAAKGLDVVLRAFAALRAGPATPAFLLLAVAADSEEERKYLKRLERLAGVLGIRQFTAFLKAPLDIPDLLNGADVVWNLSREEGFGRVIVESIAAGVPVVATNVGGVREVLGEGWPYLVKEGDTESVAKITADLLWGDASSGCPLAVDVERFRPEVVARQVVREYERILSGSMESVSRQSPIGGAK